MVGATDAMTGELFSPIGRRMAVGIRAGAGRIVLVGSAVAVMVAGCGDDPVVDETFESADATSEVEWRHELISPDAVGSVAAAAGEGATVVLASGEEALTAA